MNRNITVGLAVGFLILSAIGFSVISGMKKPAELKEVSKVVKQVKGLKVKNTSLTTQLEITGRLQAAKKIEVFTEVGGTLLPNGNRFREGNFFKKGSVLVKVDNSEQMLGLLAQKSSLMNQITLMLPDLKSDYPNSFPNWQQYLDKMDVNKALEPLPEPVSDQEKYFVSAGTSTTCITTSRARKKGWVSSPFMPRLMEHCLRLYDYRRYPGSSRSEAGRIYEYLHL